MKRCKNNIINILAAGFSVLLLLSVLLFWVRWLPQTLFTESLRYQQSLGVSPSGLFPTEIENDPNVVTRSEITAQLGDVTPYTLAIIQDIESVVENFRRYGALAVYYSRLERRPNRGNTHSVIYFDKKLGLFVYCDILKEELAEKYRWTKKIHLYAGPNGISDKLNKPLGRFFKPLTRPQASNAERMTIYDRVLRQFFAISFTKKTLTKGPKLAKDYEPIQIGQQLYKNWGALSNLRCSPPLRKATEQEAKDRTRSKRTTRDKDGNRITLIPFGERIFFGHTTRYLLILDKAGQIQKLDTETLELSGPVGYLTEAASSGRKTTPPNNLLSYYILPLSIADEHKGLIAASLSSEGMSLALSIFNENGELINIETTRLQPLEEPGGLAMITGKYIVENLQPPILSLASYFTASSFEAGAGHRGLFILPNSFVAMFARNAIGIIAPFFYALLIILPSIILGVLLAWRIRKDASVVGLSQRAKLGWTIGTICFGLSAYITYRLTRTKITLVTCVNCGRPRRPDMENCHRCGSKWLVPELTPPAWRVID